MGYKEEAIIGFLKNLKKEGLDIEKLSAREKRFFELISAIITEKIEPEVKVIMARMMNLQTPVASVPRNNESAVITTENVKSAALLFDRVWTPYMKDVPEEIGFFGNSNLEVDLWSCIRISDIASGYIDDRDLRDKIVLNSRSMLGIILAGEVLKSKEKIIHKSYNSQYPFTTFIHQISILLNSKYNLNIKTLFPSRDDYELEYSPGDHRVLFACLKDVALPDEKELAWEQILEIRKDKVSKERLRKLIHWLDKEMVGKSTSFVKDEINQKLEEYEGALRKHGIKTLRGTVGKLLDYQNLVKAAVTFGVVSSLNIGIDPLLAATGYMLGKTAIEITDLYLDYKDLQIGPNSEISYLYELKKK